MKTRFCWFFILTWLACFQASPAAKASVLPMPKPVPSADELAQDPGNLALKQTLDQEYQDVWQLYQETEPTAENYVQQYANKTVDKGSPEEAAGLAAFEAIRPQVEKYRDALAEYSGKLSQLRRATPPVPVRVNLYFDMRTLLAREEPKYDVSKIQAEIDGVKTALERLEAVRENNAARIEEWQKKSEKASHDALEMGANLSVDLLTSALKDRADAIDKQLQKEADLLAGETDPARRKAIQDTFKELNDHKEQLKKAQEAAEVAHEGVDRIDELDKATDGPEESEELQSTSQKVSKALEEAWADCDQAGALPEGAKEAKQMVDAVYLASVQVVAVGQINAANYDAEQYLKAVNSLSHQYKKLVDLKNAVQSPPQLIPPR